MAGFEPATSRSRSVRASQAAPHSDEGQCTRGTMRGTPRTRDRRPCFSRPPGYAGSCLGTAIVGIARFERTTLRPPAGCAAKLRHIPKYPWQGVALISRLTRITGGVYPVPGPSVAITSWSPARYCRSASPPRAMDAPGSFMSPCLVLGTLMVRCQGHAAVAPWSPASNCRPAVFAPACYGHAATASAAIPSRTGVSPVRGDRCRPVVYPQPCTGLCSAPRPLCVTAGCSSPVRSGTSGPAHRPKRMVGTAGLEPATSWFQTRRASQLRYIPWSRHGTVSHSWGFQRATWRRSDSNRRHAACEAAALPG